MFQRSFSDVSTLDPVLRETVKQSCSGSTAAREQSLKMTKDKADHNLTFLIFVFFVSGHEMYIRLNSQLDVYAKLFSLLIACGTLCLEEINTEHCD